MKNVNIMGVTNFLGRGSQKSYIYGKLPKKGGLGNLHGGLVKNRGEGVFEGG